MKANSAEPLLRALAPLVTGFKVASGGELAKLVERSVSTHWREIDFECAPRPQ